MTGLERLIATPKPLGRAGIYTNHTGVTSDFAPASVALIQAGIKLEKLFAPEHGIDGSGKEGEAPEVALDKASGLPVITLYDKKSAEVVAALEGLDCVLFDIQSLGVRFYTYLTSLKRLLEACQTAKVRLVVLDRPNPHGTRVEGALLEPQYASFVGVGGVPLRFGRTYGEMATYFAAGWDGLEVVQCDINATPPWVSPSLNIPTLETVAVYPGMCLVETTNWSEGRGTPLPFQTFGAPDLDAHALVSRLNNLGLEGVRFRAHYFTPLYQKHAGNLCAGAQIHVVGQLGALLPIGLSVLCVAKEFGARFRAEWLQKLLGANVAESDLEIKNIPEMIATWNEQNLTWDQNAPRLYP
jgi:uncharacterized protein YbbC (DUF1343 family)